MDLAASSGLQDRPVIARASGHSRGCHDGPVRARAADTSGAPSRDGRASGAGQSRQAGVDTDRACCSCPSRRL